MKPSPNDARVAFAVLTAAGRRLVAGARHSARRMAQAMLEEHPTKQDAARATAFVKGLP